MNNEHILPDGQFMGNVVHRTQQLAPNRSFTAIPVVFVPSVGHVENVRHVKPAMTVDDHLLHALRYGTSMISTDAHKVEQRSADQIFAEAAGKVAAAAANPPVVFKRPVPKIIQTPRARGKSLWQKIQARINRKRSDIEQVDAHPTLDIPKGYTHAYMQPEGMPGWESHGIKPPDPLCSAYEHADKQRAVPVIRLDVSPAFYMNDEVDGALENSIDAVCAGFSNALSEKVRHLLQAKWEPKGTYKPDLDPQSGRVFGGGASSSIFERDTIILPASDDGGEWVLDIRFTTGVYNVNGHEWLGVFVHGIANAMSPAQHSPSDPLAMRRMLMPGAALEKSHHLVHKGQLDPHALYFDMFVPVEPEIVTEEWGWGAELEQLTIDKTRNAMLDPNANPEPPTYITNAWDRKAKHHKTATQIAQDTALQEHRNYELSLRIQLAMEQRERARKVLYKYSWKAVMLAVIECKQLTVEKIL